MCGGSEAGIVASRSFTTPPSNVQGPQEVKESGLREPGQATSPLWGARGAFAGHLQGICRVKSANSAATSSYRLFAPTGLETVTHGALGAASRNQSSRGEPFSFVGLDCMYHGKTSIDIGELNN